MKLIKTISNQNGSMIVNAIATSIIIAIISGVILQQSLTSIKTLRLPRIKASMTAVEGSLRYLLNESSNYTGCNADAATGFTTCIFNGDITKLKEIIPGCDDGSGTPTPCGVIVTPTGVPAGYNPATRIYTADIVYQGTEIAVKGRSVSVEVPVEILTQANVNCPPAGQPDDILFKGFNASGQKICAPIPNNNGCPPGQFLSGFDPATMTVQCQSITASTIACPAGQMLESVSFTGNSFSGVCKVRPPPSTVPGWNIPP